MCVRGVCVCGGGRGGGGLTTLAYDNDEAEKQTRWSQLGALFSLLSSVFPRRSLARVSESVCCPNSQKY